MIGVPVVLVGATSTEIDVVAVCPAVSRTTAVSVCEPADSVAVSRVTEYGAAVSSAPKFAPSTLNCTPAIPASAFGTAVTSTFPEIEVLAAGDVIVIAGGAGGDAEPVW